jgi:eukaryotic-like serine/threonine-protein kinase
LGRGTTTEVNLCRLLGVQGFVKEVVVKRLLPQFAGDAQLRASFLDEARRAARLSHPHIAQVFEVGENEHGPYVAMEYVRGVTLALVAARAHLARKLQYGHIAKLMAGVSDALAYVHGAVDERGEPVGPVHRHLRAANIIVTMEGVPKLIDVAPEPIGQEPARQRADVFAAGATLFEVSTWRQPAGGKDWQRPRQIVPGYPPALENIVMAALERSATPACDTAAQLRDLLEEFAATPEYRSSTVALAQWLRELFPDFSSLARASGWTLPPMTTSPVRAAITPAPNPDQAVTPPAMLLTEDRLPGAAAAVAAPRSRWGQALRGGGAWKWTALAATAVAIGVIWATASGPVPPAPIATPAPPDPELRARVQQLEQELTRRQEHTRQQEPAVPEAVPEAAPRAPPSAEASGTAPAPERKPLAGALPARRGPVQRRGTPPRRHALAGPGPAQPLVAAEPVPPRAEVVEAPAPPAPVAPPEKESPPGEVASLPPPPETARPAPAPSQPMPERQGGLVRSSLSTGALVSARPKDPVPIPSLPRSYASADPAQVGRVCQLVERAAVNLAAVSPEYARGLTGVLQRSLRPGSPIYPIAMYYFVVREAGLGHDQATAASNLAAAQRSGLILRYKDLPGIETNP